MLIAAPALLDSNFVKTVVLLLRHTEQGALGMVVNRPTSKTVKELWKDVGQSPCGSELPVYLGGPVAGPLMAVHTYKSLAELEILPGVFFAAQKKNLDELVIQEDHLFKVFIGHAGWGPGQLDNEIQSGAWLATPATAEYVFCNTVDMWKELLQRIGESTLQSMLKIKHIPEDPSAN